MPAKVIKNERRIKMVNKAGNILIVDGNYGEEFFEEFFAEDQPKEQPSKQSLRKKTTHRKKCAPTAKTHSNTAEDRLIKCFRKNYSKPISCEKLLVAARGNNPSAKTRLRCVVSIVRNTKLNSEEEIRYYPKHKAYMLCRKEESDMIGFTKRGDKASKNLPKAPRKKKAAVKLNKVLSHMKHNPGKVISFEKLVAITESNSRNIEVYARNLICRMKKRLEKGEKITGVYGKGYVYSFDPPAPSPAGALASAAKEKQKIRLVGEQILIGNAIFNPEAGTLISRGEHIPLTNREKILLKYILSSPNKMMSFSELIKAMSCSESMSSIDSKFIVSGIMIRLRNKLEENSKHICCEAGKGYYYVPNLNPS